MKFSVIIPLYNKAPYIRKALESVFAQTYTDYELIIVDDGSTDNSDYIADKYIRYNTLYSPNVRLLRQANNGVSVARNNGVEASKGEYIAFLDADDWWEPTFLEKMTQLIDDYPEAGLYASNYYYYKGGKNIVKVNIQTGYFNYPKEYYKKFAMPITSITAVIPRKIYNEMGGFPTNIHLGEDFLLWAKIAIQYPVVFLNIPLAWYNNDIPATLRATRNLHAPEYHMLFHLDLLGIKQIEVGEWKLLLDKLRVNGLLDYWMSNEYHNQAAEELKKVDWSKQPLSIKKIYKTPIWILKVRKKVKIWGSLLMQKL